MSIPLAQFLPAHSIQGSDQYLILGVEEQDCLVIDQDGDMRWVAIADLKTKWMYHRKDEVWYTTQGELEEPDEG